MTYEHDGAHPFFHVFPREQDLAGSTLELSLRRILTQFSFEIELTQDQEELEVLDLLRRDFLLRADFYPNSRDFLPYELTFDSNLLVPYDEMLHGGCPRTRLPTLVVVPPCT